MYFTLISSASSGEWWPFSTSSFDVDFRKHGFKEITTAEFHTSFRITLALATDVFNGGTRSVLKATDQFKVVFHANGGGMGEEMEAWRYLQMYSIVLPGFSTAVREKFKASTEQKFRAENHKTFF
jgi:hypothetical protein